jgi:D-glycero-alpha-D-manno-heptose-7-phosphate kinase
MIISKTPLRVSLFGGGSDYKGFYSQYGSRLIGFCIDKYSYISLRRTPAIFPFRSSVSYSKTELVSNNRDIQHNGVRGVLEYLNITHGVEISYAGDLPAQTGTGSSSSFIVGLLNAIYTLKNKKVSKKQLAEQAIHIERELLCEPGGVQDQIWAAYGGINSIEIKKDGDFEVKPLPISREFVQEFIDRSLLIYTGKTRKSFRIANDVGSKDNYSQKKNILDISNKAYDAFLQSDIDKIAYHLANSWENKKQLSPLVCPKHVDSLYNSLESLGMIGGKLLGAGGSGFVFGIFKTKEDKGRAKKRYRSKNINFEIDNNGSQIINR